MRDPFENEYKRREAFCLHYMLAEVYRHNALHNEHVEILTHDVDLEGVDLTLVKDADSVPLQLKSRWFNATTQEWEVRRRIPVPNHHSPLHKSIFWKNHVGPDVEGLGGALVVQEIYPITAYPWMRVWYRVGSLALVFLRDEKRFEAFREALAGCPRKIRFRLGDLTPPLDIGEAISPIIPVSFVPLGHLLEFPPDGDYREYSESILRGRTAFRTYEDEKRKAFRDWRTTNQRP